MSVNYIHLPFSLGFFGNVHSYNRSTDLSHVTLVHLKLYKTAVIFHTFQVR